MFFSTVYSLLGLAWYLPRKDHKLFYLQGRKKVTGGGGGAFTTVA